MKGGRIAAFVFSCIRAPDIALGGLSYSRGA